MRSWLRYAPNFYRIPSKLRRIIRARQLARQYLREDPGAPASDIPIEVVIPAIAKDLRVLPLSIESARRFIQHPVRRVTLIAPPDPLLTEFGARHDVRVIDERTLMSPAVAAFQLNVDGADRSGWLRQQLLKLSADRIVETDRFLVLDADTCFVRPVVFVREGRDVLFCSDGWHNPYYRNYRRLVGGTERYRLSFIAHHALFNVQLLKSLRTQIEQHCGQPWDAAILATVDRQESSGFSEYETYGNFVAHRHADRVTLRYWHNAAVRDPSLATLDALVERFGRSRNTISMHSWDQH